MAKQRQFRQTLISVLLAIALLQGAPPLPVLGATVRSSAAPTITTAAVAPPAVPPTTRSAFTLIAIAWGFDAHGRPIAPVRAIAGAGSFTTLYAYDSAGRVVTTIYPDGETVAQTYNTRGLPFSVGEYVSGTTYNALGQPVTRTYGNGTTTAYTYHAISQRLSGIASAGALTLTYAYDPVGNVRTITDTSNSGQVQTFAYDALDRLTGAQPNGTTADTLRPTPTMPSGT